MLSMVLIVLINLLHHYNVGRNIIPFSVVFISFFISSLLLYQYRLMVKNVFTFYKGGHRSKVPVIVFGAGVAGFLTKQAVESDMTSQYKLVAFIDDDPKKNGKDINGIKNHLILVDKTNNRLQDNVTKLTATVSNVNDLIS